MYCIDHFMDNIKMMDNIKKHVQKPFHVFCQLLYCCSFKKTPLGVSTGLIFTYPNFALEWGISKKVLVQNVCIVF